MNRFLAGLTGLLVLAACGQQDDSERLPEPSPALWEVRRDGQTTGWLFGTIHALPEGTEWRTPLLERVLGQTGLLVVEIAALDDAAAAASAFGRVANSQGLPPLLRRVPATERDELRALLAKAGHDEQDFAATETWAAALILSNALRTHDPANGTDRELLREAQRVMELESFDAQFALFDRLAEEDQVQLLVAMADETEEDISEESLAQWLRGDLEALEREALEGLLADPELREALQISRNRRWVAPIVSTMEAGKRPLVAVGAAHMVGPQGLPALLQARGYAVRRLQ